MRAAAEQIDDATAANKTFGGGYGPGIGLMKSSHWPVTGELM